VGARQAPAELVRHGQLVRGIAEREEKADGDRLRVDLGQGVEVELLQDALRADPLVHAVAAIERHERLGMVGAQSIEMRARLAAELEEVLEPGGGYEGCPRALALEERVGRDRGAMRETLDLCCAHGLGSCDDRILLARLRGHLCRRQAAVREQHRIGEGSSHVDAEHSHARRSWQERDASRRRWARGGLAALARIAKRRTLRRG
jgi:hypothetical protein